MTDLDAAAEPRWLVPRGLIVVLAVTGLLVSVLAMREFASILGPVLLALILAMGVHPLTGILRRRGAPMWLAVTVTLVRCDPESRGVVGVGCRSAGHHSSLWVPGTVSRLLTSAFVVAQA